MNTDLEQQIANMQKRLVNAKAFFKLVSEMRTEQKHFFATHLDEYKKRAIALEKQVDAIIENATQKAIQLKLF